VKKFFKGIGRKTA